LTPQILTHPMSDFLSQPDGFSEPVSGVLTCTQRDLMLSELSDRVMRLGFLAMKAHALGAIEHWTFDDLPARQQQELRTQAEAFVNGVVTSPLRDQGIRRTRLWARRWLESEMTPLRLEIELGSVNVKCLDRAIDALTRDTEPNIVTEILSCERHEMTQPLALSERAQTVRAALRAVQP